SGKATSVNPYGPSRPAPDSTASAAAAEPARRTLRLPYLYWLRGGSTAPIFGVLGCPDSANITVRAVVVSFCAHRPGAGEPAGGIGATGNRAVALHQPRTFPARLRRAGAGDRAGQVAAAAGAGALPRRRVSRPHLPRSDTARRRPCASIPLHFSPLAQPGRHGPRPGAPSDALCPRQGPAIAASLYPPARRPAFCPARAGHRRAPRHALPRNGDRQPASLPRDPRRRPRPRR